MLLAGGEFDDAVRAQDQVHLRVAFELGLWWLLHIGVAVLTFLLRSSLGRVLPELLNDGERGRGCLLRLLLAGFFRFLCRRGGQVKAHGLRRVVINELGWLLENDL